MFEPRQKQSTGPIIIVNGETYCSPEDMPADTRIIWENYVRRMDRQGIDWRAQNRIVLSWSRAGNERLTHDDLRRLSEIDFTPGNINAPAAAKRGWPRRRSERMWLAYVLYLFPLVFYGLGSNEPQLLLPYNSVLLYASFFLLWLPWLGKAVQIYREDGRWDLSRKTLGLVVGLVMITSVASFSGVARLLHYIERAPGQVTLTVTGKSDRRGKGIRCAPRIGFEGFRSFANNVCVDDGLFHLVNAGDRVLVRGKMSPYGIEPYKLAPVSEEIARFRDVE
jgi:hypothetical protein